MYQHSQAQQIDESVSFAERIIRSRIDDITAIGKAVARSTQFRYPKDEALDRLRLSFVNEPEVARLAMRLPPRLTQTVKTQLTVR